MRTRITTIAITLVAGCSMASQLALGGPSVGSSAGPSGASPAGARPAPASAVHCAKSNKEFTFGSATTYKAKRSDGGIAVGDLNGDGLDDIVTGNAGDLGGNGSTSVGVLLNNGDGTFGAMKTYRTIDGAAPHSVTLGDLDGNGKLDIITAGSGNDNYSEYLLNNGDGTFAAAVRLKTAYNTGFSNRGNGFIRTGDVNGDHKVDIVEVSDSYLGIWLNSGKAEFPGAITPPPIRRPDTDGDASYLSTISGAALADFDGDGRLDLAIADMSYAYILLNNHHGQFAAPTTMYRLQTGGEGHGWMIQNGLVAADFNGDGKPDLATLGNAETSGQQSINVLLNKGDGTLGKPARYVVGELDNSSLVGGDFNGDGKADLAVSMSEGGVLVFMNKGDGSLAAPYSLAANGARQMAAGKFTKSGVLGMAAIHTEHGVTDQPGPLFVFPGVCQ